MRTNVALNDKLVEEAFALTGARTKKELLHLALQELVRVRRKKDLTELAGQIRLRDDFDHKAMRDDLSASDSTGGSWR
jgi:Arc/MetJ family transcription regulator